MKFNKFNFLFLLLSFVTGVSFAMEQSVVEQAKNLKEQVKGLRRLARNADPDMPLPFEFEQAEEDFNRLNRQYENDGAVQKIIFGLGSKIEKAQETFYDRQEMRRGAKKVKRTLTFD